MHAAGNTPSDLARCIDHTLLRADATPEQIDALCEQAAEHAFFGVCVHPVYVERAVRTLDRIRAGPTPGPRPVVISVAGFPLGGATSQGKADEAKRALEAGAAEIDMVCRLGALLAGDTAAVRSDIQAVANVVHRASPPGVLKVILETAALTPDQIILGCRCAAEGEADFVKTSTGFHPAGGATVEHVRLLHRVASPLRVKAAGGIRDAATAIAMIDAGAARIGTSHGVAILQGTPT